MVSGTRPSPPAAWTGAGSASAATATRPSAATTVAVPGKPLLTGIRLEAGKFLARCLLARCSDHVRLRLSTNVSRPSETPVSVRLQ
jgi:hypothetical protein